MSMTQLDLKLEELLEYFSNCYELLNDEQAEKVHFLIKEIQGLIEKGEKCVKEHQGYGYDIIDYVKQLEQQNKALTEQVKELQNQLTNLISEKGKNQDIEHEKYLNHCDRLLGENNSLKEQVKQYERDIKELEYKLGIDLQRKGSHYHKDVTCPNLEIIKQLQEEKIGTDDIIKTISEGYQSLKSERDQLKSKIEKFESIFTDMDKLFKKCVEEYESEDKETKNHGFYTATALQVFLDRKKEILGENDKK